MWSDDEYRSDSSADDDARSAQCTQEADDGEALSEREDRGDWQKQLNQLCASCGAVGM